MDPKQCEDAPGKKRHPLASCYQDEVKLLWRGHRSGKFTGFRGNYDRDDFHSFNWFAWQASDRIGRLGLNRGLVRPEVFAEHIPGADHQMRWVMAAGPFAGINLAIAYAEKYCSYCNEFQCSADERAQINQECSGMTVYQHSWHNKAQIARYQRTGREIEVNPFLMNVKPEATTADATFDNDSDDFDFDCLTVTLKVETLLDRYRSHQILAKLKTMGKVELESENGAHRVYRITEFTIPKDEVYFLVVDDLYEHYADLDFIFHTI